MKKTICVLLLFTIVFTLCSCSMYGLDELEESTSTTAPNVVIIQDTTVPVETETEEVSVSEVPASQQAVTPATSAAAAENTTAAAAEQTTVAVKTYFTDDPDNPYIVKVADKYGVDKSCLVAFVRKNSKTPGATVLQFKGNRDSNGNLITTSEDLIYVYDVQDNGTVQKTNRDGSDVEGMPQLAGKATFTLVEKYIMPDIEKFKRENRLEG